MFESSKYGKALDMDWTEVDESAYEKEYDNKSRQKPNFEETILEKES